MTACLVQLDLAARVCPPDTAGTTFALLMALQNVGMSSSVAVGGWIYEAGLERWGPRTSFNTLVDLGAVTTAACWLLVPWLRQQAAATPPLDHAADSPIDREPAADLDGMSAPEGLSPR